MWLHILFISLVGSVSSENFHSPSTEGNVTAISLVQYDLKMCMGDHVQLFHPSVQPDGFENWDFNVAEPIKTMLDMGLSSERFYRMHLQAGTIVALTRQAVLLSNEMNVSNGLEQQMEHRFREINIDLSKIWSQYAGITWYYPKFRDYFSKRQTLDSLLNKWIVWTSAPCDVNAYSEFAKSCTTNDMNEWFLGVKAMLHKPRNVSDLPHRGLYTLAARQIKSDMCGATLLLGACENVLNSSDRLRSRHVANVIRIYRQFAAGSREMDKAMVEIARDIINRIVDRQIGNWDGIYNDWVGALIGNMLKLKFYWLDFTVTVVDGCTNFSEYPPKQQCPCVVSSISTKVAKRRGIVHVTSRSPEKDSNNFTWSGVDRVVQKCSAAERPCEVFDGANRISGSVAAASYVATFFYTSSEAKITGTTVKMFSYSAIANVSANSRTIRKFSVLAALPCNSDIYVY